MTIDSKRWPQVTALFGDLVSLAPAQRTSRLADITDAEIRAEVRSLLDADSSVGMRFDHAPTLTSDDIIRSGVMAMPSPGTRIGAWRLLRLIGEGGMGTVYEAVRDDAGFTKRAAFKMVSRGAADRLLVQRFEAERRILARLEHRNIATLLDGGVDDIGRPWFALEYVEGERLDRWCNAHALDVRSRVQLFRQACSAVQYAHEHLVVHRDIKPANMLVADDGTLKLLDFGIAKLTDDSENPITEFGAAPMTAAYASPEQRAGRPLTTATDIYSLGVVLYELLTGMRPTPGGTSDSTPALPSRRLLEPIEERSSSSVDIAARQKISRALEGELDAIVMMALRPETDRRYASAKELGDDLQRWLDGRTVRAQPDTVGYRSRAFVRRNKLAVAGVAVGVIALVGGTVVSIQQATVARTERDRARVEQARTTRVSEFFQQVMNSAQPREGGRALTVTEAINRAVPIIDTAFAKEPDIKAAVQLSIGSTLQNLEQSERARPLLQSAYEYFRSHDGVTPSRNQTDAMWDLATLAGRDGRSADAESLYVQLASLYRRLPEYGRNEPMSALVRIAGLRVDVGDLRGAVAAYDSLIPQRALETRADSLDHAATLGSRGVALATLGNFARATQDFAAANAINERLLGEGSFATAQVLQPYAGALLFTGRAAAAESVARRSLRILRKEFGDSTATTLAAARMLGTVLVAEDRCSDAISVFNGILSHRGPYLRDTDGSVGYSLAYRGFCRARQGDVRGGVTDAREGMRITRSVFGEKHYVFGLAENLTGAALGYGAASGHAEAERLLVNGADVLRKALDPQHPRVKDADARVAEFRARRSRGQRS